MAANVQIQQILIKRGNTAQIAAYTGPIGEPIYNTQTRTIHMQDGRTAGGSNLATYSQLANLTSVVANIQANTSSLYSNANVASYLPGYTGTVKADLINFVHGGQINTNNTGAGGATGITITANISNDINGIYIQEGIDSYTQIYTKGSIYFYTDASGAAPQWTFGVNGDTSLPGNLSVAGNINFTDSPAGSITGATNISTGTLYASGNVTIGGNLIVNGNTTTVNTNNFIVDDNIIYMANANPANNLDIGFAGHFNNGTYQHTGLVRQATSGQWKLFSNVVPEPGNTINFTNAIYDPIQVGNITSPTITDLYSNAAVQSANIATLTANAASQAADITTLYANAGAQANSLLGANAAIVTANTAMKAYVDAVTTAWTANAATQQGLITSTNANVTAANATIATLQANVGGFYTWANANFGTSSYANANVAAYLPTYTGNVSAGNIAVTTTVTASRFQVSAAVPNGGAYITDYSGSLALYSNASIANTGILIGGNGYLLGPNGSRNAQLNYGSVGGQFGIYQLNLYGGQATAIVNGGTSNVGNIGSSTTWFSNLFVNSVTAANYLFANGVNILSTIAPSSTYSNTNVAAYLPTDPTITTLQANLGVTQIWANANIASINANIGGFYTWANTNFGTSNYSNSNVTALFSANTVSNISLTSNASIAGNLTVGIGQGGFLFRKLAGGTGAALYNLNVNPGVTNYNMLTDGGSLTFNTASGGSIYTGINNTVVTTVTATGLTVTGNITAGNIIATQYGNSVGTTATYTGNVTTTGNIVAPNYLFANGVNILSTIAPSSTYSNTNVAAYLTTATITTTGNITAGNVISTGSYVVSNITTTGSYGNITGANVVSANTISATNFVYSANGVSILSGITASSTYSNANVVANLQNYVTNISSSANIATTANMIAPNYLFANGVNILSTIAPSSTYSNTNVAAYLTTATITTTGNITAGNLIGTQYGNTFGTTATYSGNVAANYFIGNGAALTGVNYASIGNIYGSSSNVTLQAGSYNWTFDNTGNLSIPTNGNIIWANGTVFSSGTGGGSSGTTYTNANVVSMLAANSSLFISNVGNVSTYSLQANNTQVFIGPNTAITSGNAATPNSTFLLNNLYFAANGTALVRNTATGAGIISIDPTGTTFSGTINAVTANAVPTLTQYLKMSSTLGAQFSGAITTPSSVTAAGFSLSSGSFVTSLATLSLFNATATTINMGQVATTITLGSATVGGTGSNVFVGNAIGSNSGNLTVRAFGAYNTLTTYGVAGGYNSPPYNNQSLTGGSGTGMIASYSATGGYPNSFVVTNPGTGYKNGDILGLPGGGGATVLLTNYNSTKTGNGLADYNFGIDGNLILPGNLVVPNTTTMTGNLGVNGGQVTIFDSILGLHTYANLAPWATDDGKDIGIRMHYYNGADKLAFFGLENSTKSLQFLIDATEVTSNVTGTFGNLQLGSLFVSNATAATGATATTSGALYVAGGAGIAGNLYVGNLIGTQYGNTVGTTATFSGNITTTANVVAGDFLFANGVTILSTVSGGSSTYSNANVVANLANYVTNIVSTANITAGNLIGTQYGNTFGTTATFSGNVTAGNLIGTQYGNTFGTIATYTGNVTVGNLLVSGNIIDTGALSIISGSNGNINLIPNGTGIVSVTGAVSATGNVTAANIVTTGTTSGNISGANVISANTFQVSNGIFWANGTAWSSSSGGGTTYSNSNVIAYLTAGNVSIGNVGYTVLPNIIAQFTGNVNSYAQINVQNISSGTAATTEIVATANNGTDTIFFVDMGIAGNTYNVNAPNNSLGNVIYANDAYLYAQGNTIANIGGNLALGTTTPGRVVTVFAGGINNTSTVATFANTGLTVTANITAGNITATQYGNSIGTTATYSGNITAANIVTTGTYGNITNANVISANNISLSGFGVTMVNRPAFRVYGSGVGSWNTTANVNLKGGTLLVDYNQGSYFNSTTGVFTAPVAGLYQTTLIARVGSNNGLNQLAVFKNGSSSGANVIAFWETDTNVGTATHFGVSGVAKLAVGDWLSANIVSGNVNFDQNDSWTITYIG